MTNPSAMQSSSVSGSPRRAALVTGGSSGIGLAVARTLLDDGNDVTICGRDSGRLDEAAALLASHGEVQAVVADVTDQVSVDRLVRLHRERFGRLDTLISAAGAVGLGGVTSSPVEDLDSMFSANVRSSWMVVRAAHELLRAAGQEHGRAVVVTVGSVLGRHGNALTAAYSTTKAALFGFSQALHDELAESGVRVTTIAPAFVATPMTEPLADLDRAAMIRPDDVGEAVRFLTRLSSSCSIPEIMMLRTEDRFLRL